METSKHPANNLQTNCFFSFVCCILIVILLVMNLIDKCDFLTRFYSTSTTNGSWHDLITESVLTAELLLLKGDYDFCLRQFLRILTTFLAKWRLPFDWNLRNLRVEIWWIMTSFCLVTTLTAVCNFIRLFSRFSIWIILALTAFECKFILSLTLFG